MTSLSLDALRAAPGARLTSGLRLAALLFALWTLFGLLWATPSMLGVRGAGEGASLWTESCSVIVFYWGWALLTPGVLALVRRADAHAPGPRGWAAVALAAPLVVVVHGIVYLLLLRVLQVDPALQLDAPRLWRYAVRHGGGDVATYLSLAGAYFLLAADRRAREREVAASTLEARLARADLELLRWQLQPHFLFNALNTVSTLVLKGEARPANRAIELIARYLRAALAQRPDEMVALGEELAVVRRYVEIEALRFGDRLRLETRVPDELLDARVPGAILQPLVENAIRHGLAGGPGGPITIAAARADGRLLVTVADPGGAAHGAHGAHGDDGFGLRYVRERLRHFYGADARCDLAVSAGGAVATLTLGARARG